MIFLMGLGLVQVYSSSYMYAIEKQNDGLLFFKKQLLFVGLSIALLFWIATRSWQFNKKLALFSWVVAIIGVVATFVPGVAVKVGGAHRWINLPLGFRFEPAELLRVSFPVVVAVMLTPTKARKGLAILAAKVLLIGTPLMLLLQQPDFGSFLICLLVSYCLLFVSGLRWGYVVGSFVSIFVAAIYLVASEPYRRARVIAFIDPWADQAEKGFQVIQSMLSFYSGGLFGVGMGQGQGKLFFLPEAHTDFTLAVLAEESGFLGFALVLLIYGFLLFRGLQIAIRAQDQRDRLIATGITLTLGLSIFINVGVATGLLPTKGLTLPFLSYGGSSLLCTSLACGWLLSLEASLGPLGKVTAVGVRK